MFKIGLFCPFFPMFSDNFGEKGGGHYMCLVGEKRRGIQRKIWWCINDSFPIKLMERRRPQQTRTENDYQQLDEGRLNEGTVPTQLGSSSLLIFDCSNLLNIKNEIKHEPTKKPFKSSQNHLKKGKIVQFLGIFGSFKELLTSKMAFLIA